MTRPGELSVELPVPEGSDTAERKREHLRLAMHPDAELRRAHFDAWRFEHVALPELSLEEIDPSIEFLGHTLQAPLVVSCMTGGTAEAGMINRRLAEAAEACGIALGVGSQRAALEDPSLEASFHVREYAPHIPILANLGAVQLNYGYGVEECRRAVGMIDADALVLHLNVLQEAIQPEGQTDFRGLLPKIARVVAELDVPVIVKEIGSGISGDVARRLAESGVRIIDVAGAGGTSWARIEGRRAGTSLGEVFAEWGIPTPDAIRQVAAVGGLTVIGSGGVRSGLDVAKALALGAELAGMARPFLLSAARSVDATIAAIRNTVRELEVAMLCVGARRPGDLRHARIGRASPHAAIPDA
ncbi:MAG: type 2 isopentenyl-diphosphate Delta-isomerase [Longimicrobiales bacterium]|nr:type 2 isopentenyl-diphosphate Delta-isomerase [Longimicrobiales bacterium]